MKGQLKKRITVILVICAILGYSMNVCGVNMIKVAAEVKEENDYVFEKNTNLKKVNKKDDYIIFNESQSSYNQVTSQYKESESISTVSENLVDQNKIAVCEMTGTEASALQESDGVCYIEKDSQVKGNGKIKNKSGKKGAPKTVHSKKQKQLSNEWNIEMVQAEKGKDEVGPNGSGRVKVAVIDSGVDFCNDVDVKDYIDLVPGDEEVLPLYSDVSGHGTSVAGIIAAQENDIGITGINPNVELYSAKVLDSENAAPISRVIEGIYWAIEHQVNIINMSFGTAEDSQALHSAIKAASDAGILLIASAGNTGAQVEYPAAYEEVVAVGAVASDGTIGDESAVGDEIELVAPGEKVASTGGFQGTVICSGTSMAAPHVTGIASLLWEKDKAMSAGFIRALLAQSANQYGDEQHYGNGLVDYEYAKKIYDEFKVNYQEGLKTGVGIAENESAVETIEENKYVEGRWSQSEHQDMVNGMLYSELFTTEQLKNIKLGAVYPDQAAELEGLDKSPNRYFNGAGDYVLCSQYLSLMANDARLYEPSHYYSGSIYKSYGDAMKDMYDRLVICCNRRTANGLVFDKWFMWGLVVHNVADAYAHNAYMQNPNTKEWFFLTHTLTGKNGNVTYFPGQADNLYSAFGRFKSAQQAVNSTLYEAGRGHSITFRVFEHQIYFETFQNNTGIDAPYYSWPFKMDLLYQFSKEIDYGASYSQILKDATYGKVK